MQHVVHTQKNVDHTKKIIFPLKYFIIPELLSILKTEYTQESMEGVTRLFGISIFAFLFLWEYRLDAQSEGPLSGSSSSNTSLTGASENWSNTSNALSSNDSYASTSLSLLDSYSNYLFISNFGFSLPTNAIIGGIEVEIERFGNNIRDNRVRIVKGGSVGSTDRSKAGGWSSSDTDTYLTYGSSSDLWGQSWTASDINASDFGIALSATKTSLGLTPEVARVDHIRITVHYDVPLPVGFLEFSCSSDKEQVVLNWSTSWEDNNSHFEVQRAGQNFSFEPIGITKGKGDSTEPTHYRFEDKRPINGHNYYRLKQTDLNGTFSYSEIALANFESNSGVSLFPQLVTDQLTLDLPNIESPADYQLRILSSTGQLVHSITAVNHQTNVPRNSFGPSGTYMYQVLHHNKLVARGKVMVKEE